MTTRVKQLAGPLVLFVALLLPAAGFAAEGWIALFDGKSTAGWIQRGGKAVYTVEYGALVGRTVLGEKNSFLCPPKEYADFVLEFEVWVDPRLNSGVQVRSESSPDYRNGVVHGYQVEIDPSERAWSGGIYDEQGRGWLTSPKGDPAAGKRLPGFFLAGFAAAKIRDPAGPHFLGVVDRSKQAPLGGAVRQERVDHPKAVLP